MVSYHKQLYLCITLAFLAVRCVADDVDVIQNRCTRWHHSSMLRDTSIFVDGGVELFRDNATTWLGFSKYIFEIDMSAPWDTNTNFTERRIGRFGNSAMGANPPNMVRGGLFRGPGNDSRLFTFGGSTFLANTSDPDWQQPSSDEYSLWSYDTSSMTWGQYDITYAVPRRPNWGAVAEAISLGIGFVLNGQVDRGSSYVMYTVEEYIGGVPSNATNNQINYLEGLLVIDLSTQATRNVSTKTLGSPRVAGGLIHTQKFGKTNNGTLVTFGGMVAADVRVNTFTNGVLVDFGTVSLCDSFKDENVTWVNQTTSGETPPPRIDFCVLPAPKSAKDNSSHNFYMYGGYDPGQSIIYDDVWVLSLPSFTWTKVYSGATPRFGHTCHTAGKRQLMSVGGSLNSSLFAVETIGNIPNLNDMECDGTQSVSLFDVTELKWGTYFDAYGAEYQVPQSVVDVIGGTGDGGATMKEPVGGFAQAAMSTIFNPPKTSPTIAVTPTKTPSKSGPSSGVIAGAVVGSVAGFIIILTLVLVILRTRRKKRSHGTVRHELNGEFQTEELDAKSPEQELPAEFPVQELAGDDVFAELEANETGEGKDLNTSNRLSAHSHKEVERGNESGYTYS